MAYWTTREVAQHLRLNEKKIYALVKAGKLPAARVSGKWLFDQDLVDKWVRRNTIIPTDSLLSQLLERLLVIQGSDDWLLERALDALREQLPSSIVSSRVGSFKGLAALKTNQAHLAGFHVDDAEVGKHLPNDEPSYLVALYEREQGLVIGERWQREVKNLDDVASRRLRFATRQTSAGTTRLTERLLAQTGLSTDQLDTVGPFNSHMEVALAVRSGQADAGMVIRVAAERTEQIFAPLHKESFRLAVPRRFFSEPPIALFLERLFDWVDDQDANSAPGYATGDLGKLTIRPKRSEPDSSNR